MPPIRTKKFPNEIIKSIARNNNVINGIVNDKMHYHIHRRQEGIKNKVNPTPVSSIATITLSPGPIISVTLFNPITTGTDNNATAIATDISATPASDVPVPVATDTLTPKIPEVPLPSIPPTITTPLNSNTLTAAAPTQTQNPLSSSSSIFPSTSSSSLPIPSTVPSNNALSNNINAWMLPVLVISILMMILIILGLVYRKRKRNTLQNINAGDITDKDKEHGSKTNSLTSSINSISSSFKIKKGKIVPGDINVDIPPAPIVVDEEKLQMPILKRTPTTVSAFQELVDEHINLRNSTNSGIYTIASRLSNTPTYVNYDAEEGSSSNAINVIPLHQERIDTIIPYSSANGGSSSNNPFDTSNNDDNDNQ